MRITDLPVLYTASIDDILYIVDKSDTSDFLSGSSKQINLFNLFRSITVVSSSYALTSSYAWTSSYSQYAATASMAQNAQDILVYVKNTSGAVIPKGKVVRIVGVDNSSNVARIELADYSNENKNIRKTL